MNAAVSAYIGLGSNLDSPREQIQRAYRELDVLPGSRVLARSHLYKSRPLGPQNQPDYINSVVLLETTLTPLELLDGLHQIEQVHGRWRTPATRWGARSLDMDILVYAALHLETPGLTLPHPQLHARSFVLYPLAELAPTLMIPGHGPVQALRDKCHMPAIERYEESIDE